MSKRKAEAWFAIDKKNGDLDDWSDSRAALVDFWGGTHKYVHLIEVPEVTALRKMVKLLKHRVFALKPTADEVKVLAAYERSIEVRKIRSWPETKKILRMLKANR